MNSWGSTSGQNSRWKSIKPSEVSFEAWTEAVLGWERGEDGILRKMCNPSPNVHVPAIPVPQGASGTFSRAEFNTRDYLAKHFPSRSFRVLDSRLILRLCLVSSSD